MNVRRDVVRRTIIQQLFSGDVQFPVAVEECFGDFD